MKAMTRDEFISFVSQTPDGEWTAPREIARYLSMHIPPAEQVLGWLRLDANGRTNPKLFGVFVILTEHHFLRVQACVDELQHAVDVTMESVPLGRLRSIRSRANTAGAGVVILDFAGNILRGGSGDADGDQIVIRIEKEGPAAAVSEFLEALASVRK